MWFHKDVAEEESFRKTGDEMLADLGWKLTYSDLPNKNKQYNKGIYDLCIHCNGWYGRGVFKVGQNRFSPEEIVAIAHVIVEMGGAQ